MMLVHFRASQQIIQRPDRVPGTPRSEELSHQRLLVTGIEVFPNARTDLARLIEIEILQPLALSNGIENKTDIAEPRQSLREGLVRFTCLARRDMPASPHHSGKWKWSFLRYVKVRRN